MKIQKGFEIDTKGIPQSMYSIYTKNVHTKTRCQSVVPAPSWKLNEGARIHTLNSGRVHILQRSNNLRLVNRLIDNHGS